MAFEPKVPVQDDAMDVSSAQSSLPQNIEEAGGKAAFLATFTPQDDKDIMRKVDKRFLLLIGILYMTKNASRLSSIRYIFANSSTDRLPKRIRSKSLASWRRQKYLERTQDDLGRIQLGSIDLLRSLTLSAVSRNTC
jgi:hypothetical protein